MSTPLINTPSPIQLTFIAPAATVAKSTVKIDPSTENESLAAKVEKISYDPIKIARCTARQGEGSCQRKLTRLDFEFGCKCNLVFCNAHRQPNSHGCTIDYKGANRERVLKILTSGGIQGKQQESMEGSGGDRASG